MHAASRAIVYGAMGWTVDRAFTTLTRSARGGALAVPSPDLALLPIYALALPLFEPTHNAVRRASPIARAVIYGVGFIAAEYWAGRSLASATGRAPWNYTGARWSVHGHTRLDYMPLWAIAGLALERLHDRLTGRR